MSHWVRPAKMPSSKQGKFSHAVMRELSRVGKSLNANSGKKKSKKKRIQKLSLRKRLYEH